MRYQMVHFVGAGPGAVDLLTIRGRELIEKADVIIYAGSLVNPELLKYARKDCKIYDSAYMNLDEITEFPNNINYKYYIAECNKILFPFIHIQTSLFDFAA